MDYGALANTLTSGAGTAIQYGLNQSLQNDLMNAAVGNLTSFAQTVAGQNNPDLVQFINENIGNIQAGKITPAQAMAAVQQRSQMYGVQVPKNFTDATNSALAQEGQVAKQGYTPVERAAIQNALQGVITQQRGEQAAIAANQQAKGQYGGGQALDQEQEALQGAINNASTQGNQTEANAYQRALNAMQAEGQLGLGAGQQSFSQNAAISSAQDAINSLNTQLEQQNRQANAERQQAANTQNAQLGLQAQEANTQNQLALNTQRVGAANQTVQNLQGQENIAGGALKQAGADAGNLLPTVYKQAQAGQSTLAQDIFGSNSAIGSQISKGIGSLLPKGGSGSSGYGSGSGSGSGSGYDSGSGGGYSGGGANYSAPIGGGNYGYSTGGDVEGPGTETSDSIPVKLSNHEFVINADSAKKYKPMVEAINDDDHEGILDSLLSCLPEEHEIVVVSPKGKEIDGQKALSDALKAMAKLH